RSVPAFRGTESLITQRAAEEGESMTSDPCPADESREPRRTYSAAQVFPVVALLVSVAAAALWVPVLRMSANSVEPDYLLLGMLVLLVAFLAGELFPLHIEV